MLLKNWEKYHNVFLSNTSLYHTHYCMSKIACWVGNFSLKPIWALVDVTECYNLWSDTYIYRSEFATF